MKERLDANNEVLFNSQSTSSDVNLTNNTIGFSTFHKFRDYEKIVYLTNSQTSVGGISTGSFYHVGIVDDKTIKLYKNQSDSISGINTISLFTPFTGLLTTIKLLSNPVVWKPLAVSVTS